MMIPWYPPQRLAPGHPRYIYRLAVTYPDGSLAPGWRPACWSNPGFLSRLSRKGRRQLAARTFRWPAERHFLSHSGANNRAALLRWYGAEVTVQRSLPVTWPEERATGKQPELTWPDFDSSGIPREVIQS